MIIINVEATLKVVNILLTHLERDLSLILVLLLHVGFSQLDPTPPPRGPNHIITLLYIIKVRLRHRGCKTWFYQIVEILLNF